MLKQYFYSSLFLIICSTTYTMELTQPSLLTLPDDAQNIIFFHALNNWHQDKETFQKKAEIGAALQLTCKKFAPIEKIASYMQINDNNKNIFLLRAAQAGIPCLMRYAITEKKADLNCIEKIVGYTPLSNAVRCNNYQCCKILLEAGANVKQAEDDHTEFGRNAITEELVEVPNNYQPIHLAVKNNNIKITKLLLDSGANGYATTGSYDSVLDLARQISNNADRETMVTLLKEYGYNAPHFPHFIQPEQNQ